MYKNHFKLTRNPFDLTPDPSYFVPTVRHNEALAALYHGVRRHKGFVVVTGEVGTGKTLLLRCLLGLFRESKDIAYAYVFNGRMTSTEFLQCVLSEFGLPASGRSKYELLLDLGHFLRSRGARRMTTVLIVDEAHHLSSDILEEVRLLSNLETPDDKLLQILLVGQPELDTKLDSVELRQLKQRIAVRTQIRPLDIDETKQYIERRLKIAGAVQGSTPLFPGETIASIFLYSRGIPRLINTLCENALISAYVKRLPSVTADIVDSVAKEFRLGPTAPPFVEQREKINGMDIEQAISVLLNLYEARRGPFAKGSGFGDQVTAEERNI